MRWTIGTLLLAALAYAATGVYTVGTDQRAVVRRFGRVIGQQSEPGLHLGLPWGLDRVDLIRPNETKTVTVGMVGAADTILGAAPTADLAQFLTGDQNLVNIQATVQYTVRDPVRYLFGSRQPERLIGLAAQAAITNVLAGQSVDTVITTGKSALAIRMADDLQRNLDKYQVGVQIHSVNLTDVSPPPEVADAFTKASSARSDRERLKLEAERYRAETLARARAEAQAVINRARADHDRAIDLASSEAARFLALWTEYRYAPAITAARLYLETIAEIVPRFRGKVLVDSGPGLDMTIMRQEP